MILSFCLFLLLFVIIGFTSSFYKKNSANDYLLASQSIKPWLVGLAAVATNNSGYMFIGLIGFTFKFGLSSMWLMIGMIMGDFSSSLYFHKKFREITQINRVMSFSSAISSWNGQHHKKVQVIGGLVTFIFLATYAAAQLTAGGKALFVMFGWDYNIGIYLGGLIILIYCFSGGIRASIWTNTAQSFVMILSMGLLLFFAIEKIGGFNNYINKLSLISPNYLSIFPRQIAGIGDNKFLFLLFFLGWFLGGVCVIGQPHIMLNFMTMEKPEDISKVRIYYYSWYVIFSSLTIACGLASRILIDNSVDFDTELAMPNMARMLLPEVLLGVVLAGLFSATMSTADSQILSCASALTNDILKRKSYVATKISTIISASLSIFIALYANNSVFTMAMFSWSVLASVFAPLFIIYSFNYKLSQNESLSVMLSGLFATFVWVAFGLNGLIYESAIGLLSGLSCFAIIKLFKKNK